MGMNDLKKQMGNARFLIARSSSTLEGYRTSLKLMNLGKELGFEENKFTRVVVDIIGTKRWYLGNKLHRLDGPAVEYSSGTKVWFFRGEKHRVDGPAVIRANGWNGWVREEWWRDGIFIKSS